MCIRDSNMTKIESRPRRNRPWHYLFYVDFEGHEEDEDVKACLLYTSDAADERSSVDLGGRRIIKKKRRQAHSRDTRMKQT